MAEEIRMENLPTQTALSDTDNFVLQETGGEDVKVTYAVLKSLLAAVSETMTNKTLTSPTINSDQYLEASGTIATGDVLTMNATPIELIAAPGAGKAIVVDEVQFFLDFNSAAYVAAAGEDLTVEYGGGTDIAVIDNDAVALLTAAADAQWIGKNFAIYDASVAGTGDGVLLGGFDNEAVNASIATGEVATGDSPLKYLVKYHVVTYIA